MAATTEKLDSVRRRNLAAVLELAGLLAELKRHAQE